MARGLFGVKLAQIPPPPFLPAPHTPLRPGYRPDSGGGGPESLSRDSDRTARSIYNAFPYAIQLRSFIWTVEFWSRQHIRRAQSGGPATPGNGGAEPAGACRRPWIRKYIAPQTHRTRAVIGREFDFGAHVRAHAPSGASWAGLGGAGPGWVC